MGEGTILRQKHSNRVLYIEPNLASEDTTSSDGKTKFDVSPNLEDYCMFFDMDIEFVPRTKDIGTSMMRLIYKPNDNTVDVGYVNQGSEYGSTRMLTDLYAGIGYKELKHNMRTAELFGITSINISYDAWVCPTVEMDIVDIRGFSMFGAEEVSHPLVRGDGQSGVSSDDVDLTDSFFHAFFTFPYPRFTMFIKGFYGHPISYDMAVSDFKATFDSNTGNFGAHIKFIGFAFGMLNDITMTSLCSSISITGIKGIGREYWDEQVTERRFTYNGQPLKRLSDIAYKYQKYQKELSEETSKMQEQTADKQAVIDAFSGVAKSFMSFKGAVAETAQKLVSFSKHRLQTELEFFFGEKSPYRTAKEGMPYTLGLTKSDGHGGKIVDTVKMDAFYKNALKLVDNIKFSNSGGKIVFSIPDGALNVFKRIRKNGLFSGSMDYYYLNTYATMAGYSPTLSTFPTNKKFGTKLSSMKSMPDGSDATVWKIPTTILNDKEITDPKNIGKGYVQPFNQLSTYFRLFQDGTEGKTNLQCNEKSEVRVVGTSTNGITQSTNGTFKDICTDKVNIKKNGMHYTNYSDISSNEDVYNDCKVGEYYTATKEALDELVENLDKDNSFKEQIEDIQKSFKPDKPNLWNLKATFNSNSYVVVPIDYHWNSEPTGITHTGTEGNLPATTCAKIPLSIYTIDLSELTSKISKLSGVDIQKEAQAEQEKLESDLQSKYLNFSTSVPYIMKSLWAHVETFLQLCTMANEEIRNSHRTAETMHLNTENSNLPKQFYAAGSTDTIGAFPTVITTQSISGTPNSNAKRHVMGWIGDVCKDENITEAVLVNRMIKGTNQFYVWSNKDAEATTVDMNTTDGQNHIRIAYYQYLTNVFNKWIHGIMMKKLRNPSYQWKDEWGVDTYFDTHFLFIDTFYNRFGDDVGVNMIKLCEAIKNIYADSTISLLEFMSKILNTVDCIIQPTQGFMYNQIVNKDSMMDYYKQLFDVIPYNKMKTPELAPYFVVIYRGKPSDKPDSGLNDPYNENDSFMVSDETVGNVPLGLSSVSDTDITNHNSFPIPAIGVTYGRQYQSFFTDINVDMNTAMPNEIALKTQYQLCGAATSDNSGLGELASSIGQDLFTVYANNSYTSSVTMLGCMWIQPLMYYQLNNIPMFRGTYMIQKVTHSIKPGMFTTQFSGVRMSKYSSPFCNNKEFSLATYGSGNGFQVVDTTTLASFDNDCPYAIYDPNGNNVCGTGTFTTKYLQDNFSVNFKDSDVNSNISEWHNIIKNKSTKCALASIIVGENTSDDLSCELHATLLYNRLNGVKNHINGTYKSALWDGVQMSSLMSTNASYKNNVKPFITSYPNITDDKGKRALKAIEKVFLNSPAVIVQGSAASYTTNGNGDNGADTHAHTSAQKVTVDGLRKLYFTCHNSYSGKVLFAHKHSTYCATKQNWDFWPAVPIQKKNEADTRSKFGENLIDCIGNTYNNYKDKKADFGSTWKSTHDKANNRIVFTLQATDDNIASPLLTDILFNGYNKYLKSVTCWWGNSSNGVTKNSFPIAISCIYVMKEIKTTMLRFRIGNPVVKPTSASLFKIKESEFPDDMLKVIKKKYKNLNSKEVNTYIGNTFE